MVHLAGWHGVWHADELHEALLTSHGDGKQMKTAVGMNRVFQISRFETQLRPQLQIKLEHPKRIHTQCGFLVV
jgi:hypothetical protein